MCRLPLAIVLVFASVAHADDAGIEFYEKKVRPVLTQYCYECHGADKQEASLQVTSVAAMLRGGDQGPAIVPGKPEESLLVEGIRYDNPDFQMPPKGKMPDDKVAAIVEWIRQGAPAPKDDARTTAGAAKPAFDLAARKKHWCFQPLATAPPPAVRDTAWPRSDADRFILAKLEAARLAPAAEADARTLVRRLYFDLIGLPPAPEEVEQFVASFSRDPQGTAYAALVDELLASPRFGERWGRHWLDLVRYAETRGHEFDYLIPNAYQYRDYVVRAFNADVPYDRFVVEHLAGDLLPQPRVHPQTGANESILGTGFWFLGEECHSPVDIRQDETDRVDNKIDVMSKTFLGLTLSCARCHDHKFDALSTKDYYALAGFVLGMSYRQAAFEALDVNRRIHEDVKKLEAERGRALREAQFELLTPTLAKLDQYLLAARDVVEELRREGAAANGAAVVTATANERQIEEKRLAAWVEYLESPAADAGPLALWAAFAKTGRLETPPAATPADPATFRPRIIVDYAAISPSDWLEDGVAFGGRPRSVGEFRVGRSAESPLERIQTVTSAAVDPHWDVVRPADGNENEPSRINWRQTARTLKTPTFTLGSGKLRYLVRGSVHVHAAVASHRMNNGPLHGGLIKHLPGNDEAFRWVEHDLTVYKGQRVQIEFSPYDPSELKEGQSAECAVRGVVELDDAAIPMPAWDFGDTERRHASPAARRRQIEIERLSKLDRDAQAAQLAAFCKRLCDDAARHALLGDRPIEPVDAELVDEMLRRPELWSTPSPRAAETVAPLFKKQAELLAGLKRRSHTAPAAWEGSGVDEYVLIRGNHRTTGEQVPRRFLEAIDGPTPPEYRSSSGRLELARRLLDTRDPLPARVMVNRLWQHLFGRGLVKTVDNLGAMGETPTHPELLDHLAREFMADGWSMKRMIRRLVLSSTYRMSSARTSADEIDPQNDLYHRANIKRLEAETVRDALLAVSGRLDPTPFGPSVEVHLTPFMEGRGRPQSGPLDGAGRRSIYLRVRRNFLNPMFQAYDYPTPFTTVGRRTTSNVPAQALALMNGPLVVEQAKLWAERVTKQTPIDAAGRIDRLYAEAFSRRPTDDERTAARDFLAEQAKLYGAAEGDPRVWADLCHVLFNVKEFVFIP